MPRSYRWAAAISVFNIKVLEFLYSLRQFLTDTLCWVLIWKSAFRAFLTLGVMCMTAWKTHLITNKDLAYWENKTDHSFIQCSKKVSLHQKDESYLLFWRHILADRLCVPHRLYILQRSSEIRLYTCTRFVCRFYVQEQESFGLKEE